MNEKELSYCELRAKEVVNGIDGRRLGRIIDIVFSAATGVICGIIVPYNRRTVFFKTQDVFIPWECVKKIGEDVIIVELMDFGVRPEKRHERIRCVPPPKDHCGDGRCNEEPRREERPREERGRKEEKRGPDCDGKCEKCMLFDCDRRWNEQIHKTDFKDFSDGEGFYVDDKKYKQ